MTSLTFFTARTSIQFLERISKDVLAVWLFGQQPWNKCIWLPEMTALGIVVFTCKCKF